MIEGEARESRIESETTDSEEKVRHIDGHSSETVSYLDLSRSR